MNQSGFTLLELLMVIVIIGLLAAFVAPRYFSASDGKCGQAGGTGENADINTAN